LDPPEAGATAARNASGEFKTQEKECGGFSFSEVDAITFRIVSEIGFVEED
jgi:hypothetical protein